MAKKGYVTGRFSPDEDETVINYVSQYPTNLRVAFEQAGQELGRTTGSVSGRYYTGLKADLTRKPIMALTTNRGTLLNTKVIVRPNKRHLDALDVAKTAADLLDMDEKKALLRYMMRQQ